jgi:anti-anti-sigma factor
MSPSSQPAFRPPPEADELRCEVVREGDAARVVVSGALDLATVPILEAELADLRHAGVRRLVLDLSGLGFMDSTGLRCILERDAEARRDGFSIALVAGPPAVQRVFEVTGTAARLPFIDA